MLKRPEGRELDLDGQLAVVIGGTAGIGKAVSLLLARHGAHVTIISREQARWFQDC